MKTPREILLARHHAIEPRLDEIRRKAIGKLNDGDTKARSFLNNVTSFLLDFPTSLWRELVWPSRRIWAGLAAIWILIFIVNSSMRDQPETKLAKSSSPREMVMALRQQQQLLSELIGPSDPPVAEASKVYSPRPASQRLTATSMI